MHPDRASFLIEFVIDSDLSWPGVSAHVAQGSSSPCTRAPRLRARNETRCNAWRATSRYANDPDADRLAVAARNSAGDYEMFTGDQVGVLLGSWMLERPQDFTPIVCASMVSSRMLGEIAKAAGAKYFETLTGFKWTRPATTGSDFSILPPPALDEMPGPAAFAASAYGS